MVDKTNQKESKKSKELALHYMKTLLDVARESFLILDADFRVLSANEIFYQTFLVSKKETEDKFLYNLGNGQWNIPELRRLLEKILPDKKVVKNYEVSCNFEVIGNKTMLLNARQIDAVQLIILAIEDITVRKQAQKQEIRTQVAVEKTRGLKKSEAKMKKTLDTTERINKLMVGRELEIIKLKKEIEELKKKIKS